MRRSIHTWMVVGLLLSTSIYAIAEEITLTTLYPSPRGVYAALRVGGGNVPPFYRPIDRLNVINGELNVNSLGGGYLRTWGQSDLEFDGGPDGAFVLQNTNPNPTARTSIVGNNLGTYHEVLSVFNNGDIGLGTEGASSLVDKVEIRGSVALRQPGNADGPQLRLFDDTATAWEIDNNNGRLRFFRPNAEKMVITTDDDVGIGPHNGALTIAPEFPPPNNQHGNLDVNDVWVRAIPPNGKWISQIGLPTSGITGEIANSDSNNPVIWENMPSGLLGKDRTCIAYPYMYQHWNGGSGGRYNDLGCRYNSTTGHVEGEVGGGHLLCGWTCFN